MRAQPRSRASAAKVRLGCARYFRSRLPARQKAVGATAFSEPTGSPARLTGPGCRLRGPTGPLTSVLSLAACSFDRHLSARFSRRLELFDKDVVHHIEHAYADFSRFWREPWRGVQCGGGIGHPLLPAGVHRPPAELIVLRRALRFEGAIDELDDVHLGDAPKRIEPLGLFRSCDFQRQQFVQFVDRMAHLMPLLVGIGVDPRPAGIADIFFSLADLFEIFREFAVTLKQVDLKA